jgi:hypothetical protein
MCVRRQFGGVVGGVSGHGGGHGGGGTGGRDRCEKWEEELVRVSVSVRTEALQMARRARAMHDT